MPEILFNPNGSQNSKDLWKSVPDRPYNTEMLIGLALQEFGFPLEITASKHPKFINIRIDKSVVDVEKLQQIHFELATYNSTFLIRAIESGMIALANAFYWKDVDRFFDVLSEKTGTKILNRISLETIDRDRLIFTIVDQMSQEDRMRLVSTELMEIYYSMNDVSDAKITQNELEKLMVATLHDLFQKRPDLLPSS